MYCLLLRNWSFRLQVDSPTLTSVPVHDLSCFAYTEVISPTYIMLEINKTETCLL